MSNTFSQRSLDRLSGVDHRLQDLAFAVLQVHDCTILYGLRTNSEQARLVSEGKSRTMNSRHLTGHAIDMSPYPVLWPDQTDDEKEREHRVNRFYFFAGIVKGIAFRLGVPFRWGGDWDSDNVLNDQRFMDLVHFEIPKGSD